jgi:hypothetical protein
LIISPSTKRAIQLGSARKERGTPKTKERRITTEDFNDKESLPCADRFASKVGEKMQQFAFCS